MTKKEKASQITWVDGEDFCRYNGILMTHEKCMEMFGMDEGDVQILNNNCYICDDTIYTNKDLTYVIHLAAHAEYGDPYEHAFTRDYSIMNMYGLTPTAEQELSHVLKDSFVIHKDTFDSIKYIKPFKQFKIDHPNIDIKAFMAFMEALDCEYELNKDK